MQKLFHLLTAALGLLVALSGLAGCRLWTVRPLDWKEKKSIVATQVFNADSYVDAIWESKVVPTVTDKAIDLATLLAALDANADEAKKQFGLFGRK